MRAALHKKDFALGPAMWLLKRVPVLYFAGFLVFYSMVNYQDVTDKARVASLNRLMPSLDGLVLFIRENQPLKNSYLREWVMYYRAFEDISGPRADVAGMQGFAYYYLGQKDKAIKHFEEAIIGNPLFFWFYYNLAVIYYEQGEYAKALDYVQMAIDRDLETTNSFLNVSKPYNDLLQPFPNKADMLSSHFEEGRLQMFKMLILCHFHLKQYTHLISLAKVIAPEVKKDKYFFDFYTGMAALELKEYQGAVYYLEECVKSKERYADTFYYYSVVNKMLGNHAAADTLMTAALRLRQGGAPERPVLTGLKVRVF